MVPDIDDFCRDYFGYPANLIPAPSNPIVEIGSNVLGYMWSWIQTTPKNIVEEIECHITKRINEVVKTLVPHLKIPNDHNAKKETPNKVMQLVVSYLDLSDDIIDVLKKESWNVEKDAISEKLKHLLKKIISPDPTLFEYNQINPLIFAQLENIEALALPSNTRNRDLPSFERFKMLRSLSLKNCDCLAEDCIIKLLLNFPNLQSLDLSGCYDLTDNILSSLTSLKSLEYLSLARTIKFREVGQITDQGLISSLSQLTKLQHLDLSGRDDITDIGIASLTQLKNLRFLKLPSALTITENVLISLSQLPNLQHLDLPTMRLTNAGFVNLSKFPALEILTICSHTEITDRDLASLALISTLRSLNLSQINEDCKLITDEGIAHLSRLPVLESLTLSKCINITDIGFSKLGSIKTLTYLDLISCRKITYQTFIDLVTKLTNLKKIILLGCPNITDYAVSHAKDINASLEILYKWHQNRKENLMLL